MRPKVVTLCDKTWQLAQEKPNFSEWVRAMLLETDEQMIEDRKAALEFKQQHGRFPKWWSE